MEQLMRDSLWHSICQGLQSHVHAMAMHKTPPIQHLMQLVAQKVTSQSSPQTEQELNDRLSQRMAASAIIGSLAHGDSMIQNRPTAYAEMLEESGKLANYDILGAKDPHAVFAATTVYSMKISALTITHPARVP